MVWTMSYNPSPKICKNICHTFLLRESHSGGELWELMHAWGCGFKSHSVHWALSYIEQFFIPSYKVCGRNKPWNWTQSYISYSRALGTGVERTLCMHPICKICMREVVGSNPTVSIERERLLVRDFWSTISSIRTKYVIESNGAEGDQNVIPWGFARGAHVSELRVCRLNKMAGTVDSVDRALEGKYVVTSQLLDYFV